MKIKANALAIVAFSLVALALAPRPGAAAIVTCSNPLPGSGYERGATGGGQFTVGTIFKPASNLVITELGVQDSPANGSAPTQNGSITGFIAASVHVGLWSGTTLIAQATVTSSDQLGAGNYRYDVVLKDGTGTVIPSITLTGGTSYSVGALVGETYAYFLDGNNTTPNIAPFGTDAGITSTTSSYFQTANTFGAPATTTGVPNGRWGPANAIPEPASIGLTALTGVLILARRRRIV